MVCLQHRILLLKSLREWLKAQVIRQHVLKSERQATLLKSGFLQNASKPTGGCQCLGPPHEDIFTVLAYSFTVSPPTSLFHFELFCNLIVTLTTSTTTTRVLEENVCYPLFNSLCTLEGILQSTSVIASLANCFFCFLHPSTQTDGFKMVRASSKSAHRTSKGSAGSRLSQHTR